MGLSVVVNGRERALEQLGEPCSLSDVIAGLDLKPDRVAVELNGAICARTQWDSTQVRTGDRLEIVHFVGGGLPFSISRALPMPRSVSIDLQQAAKRTI